MIHIEFQLTLIALQPLAVKHPSYIKDTFHFLERLQDIRSFEQSYLATIDVESLYKNINNTEGLCAFDFFPKLP